MFISIYLYISIFLSMYVSIYLPIYISFYVSTYQDGEKRRVHDLAKENRDDDFMDIEVRKRLGAN